MGYSTTFEGCVAVSPPLNPAEVAYLRLFAKTRRMHRRAGPYFVVDDGQFGQSDAGGVIDHNSPPAGQPGLWCQWVPTDDGTAIEWDGGEKFYDAEAWMRYLIEHFLQPRQFTGLSDLSGDPQFAEFTWNHQVNGTIAAEGEDPDDRWLLVVKDNVVSVREGIVVYAPQVERTPEPIRTTATVGRPLPEIEV